MTIKITPRAIRIKKMQIRREKNQLLFSASNLKSEEFWNKNIQQARKILSDILENQCGRNKCNINIGNAGITADSQKIFREQGKFSFFQEILSFEQIGVKNLIEIKEKKAMIAGDLVKNSNIGKHYNHIEQNQKNICNEKIRYKRDCEIEQIGIQRENLQQRYSFNLNKDYSIKEHHSLNSYQEENHFQPAKDKSTKSIGISSLESAASDFDKYKHPTSKNVLTQDNQEEISSIELEIEDVTNYKWSKQCLLKASSVNNSDTLVHIDLKWLKCSSMPVELSKGIKSALSKPDDNDFKVILKIR